MVGSEPASIFASGDQYLEDNWRAIQYLREQYSLAVNPANVALHLPMLPSTAGLSRHCTSTPMTPRPWARRSRYEHETYLAKEFLKHDFNMGYTKWFEVEVWLSLCPSRVRAGVARCSARPAGEKTGREPEPRAHGHAHGMQLRRRR